MIRVWADARGTWHAEVPETGDAAAVARKAIRAELVERDAIGPNTRLPVAQTFEWTADPGYVVFREDWRG